MATITVNNTEDLQQTQFETISELIEVYFSDRGKVVLEEINIDDLPQQIQNDLKHSKSLGKDELYDFQG